MTSRVSWTRRDGKRPVQCSGAPASSTNPATWSTFTEAASAKPGNGVGIMLGDGLGCWDLDHCLIDGQLQPWAADVLANVDAPIWIEKSMSGDGLHVFVHAPEAQGWRRGPIEFYSRARFIAVTGNRFPT